jgi:hypothetical protein
VPDACAFPDLAGCIDDGRFVSKVVHAVFRGGNARSLVEGANPES